MHSCNDAENMLDTEKKVGNGGVGGAMFRVASTIPDQFGLLEDTTPSVDSVQYSLV